VAEPLLVERFGVSRTPARAALAQLREEGLLEALPSGGYAVSSFTERDVFDAIEIRGTLEGMAARFAAERGVPPFLLDQLQNVTNELEMAVAEFTATSNPSDYVRLNDHFHELLVQASQSAMVKRSLERVLSLPFAAPNAFVKSSRSDLPGAAVIMAVAQEQHRSIVEAIRNREGKRAEALAVEHSRCAWKYLRLAMDAHEPLEQFPVLNLIRKRTS
jgi:GntR family transcriptional regulator of vanillate catabolism